VADGAGRGLAGLGGALQRLFDPAVLYAGAADVPPAVDGAAGPPILDARISGDGRLVGFVWSQELYVVATDCQSAPVQITSGARGTELTNGLADYIAQVPLSLSSSSSPSLSSSLAVCLSVFLSRSLTVFLSRSLIVFLSRSLSSSLALCL
jgi:hypothetical protein